VIPESLRAERRWVVWRYNTEQKKIPYQAARPEIEAKINDERTWSDFAPAQAAVDAGRAQGTGFVLGEGWAGVDLDDCRDSETGTLKPVAQAIVAALDTYCEVSPSGTGLKLYLKAWLGKNYVKTGLECYAGRRYFCVTAQHLAGTPEEPQHRQAEFDALIAREFSADEPDDVAPRRAATLNEKTFGEPGRNNALASVAGLLRSLGLDVEELTPALLAVNARRCKPPLARDEVLAIARSVGRYAAGRRESEFGIQLEIVDVPDWEIAHE
jgi:hypothetical protein